MNTVSPRHVTALLAAVLLAGCASQGPRVERPEVRLDGIELQAFSFREQTVSLRFDVSNPNPFPLPVKRVRYKVFLENQQFAGGETDGSFTIPSRGDGQFSISVKLDLLNSAASLLPLLRAGGDRPLDYEVHGSLAVAIPFVKPLAFSRQGVIVVH